MNTKPPPQYFFFTLLILSIIAVLAIFWPFLSVIVLGASLAVVFHPVFHWFNKKMPWQSGWLSALICVVLFMILFCGPVLLLAVTVFQQSSGLYNTLVHSAAPDQYISEVNTFINTLLPTGVVFNVQQKLTELIGVISQNLAGILTTTLNTAIGFFLLLFTMFYFLKDGSKWRSIAIALSPLPKADDEKVLSKLHNAINGVMLGSLFLAFLQGILVAIGLAFFNVPNSALLGLAAGLASFVPPIGTALVAVPVVIFLLVTDQVQAAIGFAVWAGLLVGLVDNVLAPYLVGKKLEVPPLVLLFAILGGLSLMGPVGILMGPLAISLLYSLLSIYNQGRTNQE